ncbi:MAG: hypothetical protein ACI87A_003411 [Planctomycetota bacterium]|jgi:hypothetical protein
MTDSSQAQSQSPNEKRVDARRPQTGQIIAKLADQQLTGKFSNASAGGIMFITGDSLRISVEFEHEGQAQLRSGRLVRVQGMNAEETAFAIEFDAL